jgi:hypothetical protein
MNSVTTIKNKGGGNIIKVSHCSDIQCFVGGFLNDTDLTCMAEFEKFFQNIGHPLKYEEMLNLQSESLTMQIKLAMDALDTLSDTTATLFDEKIASVKRLLVDSSFAGYRRDVALPSLVYRHIVILDYKGKIKTENLDCFNDYCNDLKKEAGCEYVKIIKPAKTVYFDFGEISFGFPNEQMKTMLNLLHQCKEQFVKIFDTTTREDIAKSIKDINEINAQAGIIHTTIQKFSEKIKSKYHSQTKT